VEHFNENINERLQRNNISFININGTGKGYNLIQSYLETQYQRVIISNKSWQYYSEWELYVAYK
jgi:hypothetical protein